MLTVFLIILFVCLLAYNLFFIIKGRGIPCSFSQTSYLLQNWGFGYKWFMAFCITYGIILLPIWLTLSSDTSQFLAFLSCAGLIFVGTTPLYKEDYQHNIHWIAGIICVTSAIVWLIVNAIWWGVILIPLIYLPCVLFNRNNYVFWIEFIVMFITLVALIQESLS